MRTCKSGAAQILHVPHTWSAMSQKPVFRMTRSLYLPREVLVNECSSTLDDDCDRTTSSRSQTARSYRFNHAADSVQSA